MLDRVQAEPVADLQQLAFVQARDAAPMLRYGWLDAMWDRQFQPVWHSGRELSLAEFQLTENVRTAITIYEANQLAFLQPWRRVWFAQGPGAPSSVVVNVRPATPTITGLSVSTGIVGDTVTISGSGFNVSQGSGTVTFNGTTATASSWAALSITVTVPSGATTGNVVVTQNGQVSNGISFTVTGGGGPCTQTLNAGANVGTAITNAAGGAVICLNAGNYAGFTIGDLAKSSTVTIQSTTGVSASISGVTIFRTQRLNFKNLTFTGQFLSDDFGGATHTSNLTVQGSLFTGSQLVINTSGLVNSNTLIDGNTLQGYNSTGIEGRISLISNPQTSANYGITISNNTLNGGGCSDGIQIALPTGTNGGIVVGPGNIFNNLIDAGCTVHVDCIQVVDGQGISIFGNYFGNCAVYEGFYDGAVNLTLRNNLFNVPSGEQLDHQMGSIIGFTRTHNTYIGNNIAIGSKFGNPTNTNWVVTNEALISGSSYNNAGDQPGCGANCSISFMLKCTTCTTTPTGTSNVSGNAVFVGPCTLVGTSWSGCLLAAGSPGKNAASDGSDMGTLCGGRGGPGTCN